MSERLHEIRSEIEEIALGFSKLSDVSEDLSRAAELIVSSLKDGGKAIFCGNGGSAADSQHLAAELMGRYLKDREPLPAIALTVDTSALTAIGNDYGYENIFSRQLKGIGRPGDVLVGLSTSGRSKNVLEAMRAAKSLNIYTISLTGALESEMSAMADVAIKVPAARTNRIQEMHIAVGHIICGVVENALC